MNFVKKIYQNSLLNFDIDPLSIRKYLYWTNSIFKKFKGDYYNLNNKKSFLSKLSLKWQVRFLYMTELQSLLSIHLKLLHLFSDDKVKIFQNFVSSINDISWDSKIFYSLLIYIWSETR